MGRFIQPDTIVPEPGNPQDLNRYTYARNNPIRYNDPTGHFTPDMVLDVAFLIADGALIANDMNAIRVNGWTQENITALSVDIGAAIADLACAVLPGGTGGGLALRLAAGGEAAAQATVQMERIGARLGVKAIQFSTSHLEGQGGGSSGQGNPAKMDPDKVTLSDEKAKQAPKRGWTIEKIRETVKNPAMTRSTLDNPRVFNQRTGNPVTYFYTPDGHYVVIDNVTQEVVQISDTFDPNWIDPMTDQAITPIQ